jgi:hypothetical protein
MKFIHKNTSSFLNKALSLDTIGDEQDWAIEVADSDRVEEFISYYMASERDDDFDYALMSLIVASFDEKMQVRLNESDDEYIDLMKKFNFDEEIMYREEEKKLWGIIADLLKSNLNLYNSIVQYWSVLDDDDCVFASSLFHRGLLFSSD